MPDFVFTASCHANIQMDVADYVLKTVLTLKQDSISMSIVLKSIGVLLQRHTQMCANHTFLLIPHSYLHNMPSSSLSLTYIHTVRRGAIHTNAERLLYVSQACCTARSWLMKRRSLSRY